MNKPIMHASQITSYVEWQEFVRNCYLAYPDLFIIGVIASGVFGLLCYDKREEIVFRVKGYCSFVKAVISLRKG